jgi:hypothetical protein
MRASLVPKNGWCGPRRRTSAARSGCQGGVEVRHEKCESTGEFFGRQRKLFAHRPWQQMMVVSQRHFEARHLRDLLVGALAPRLRVHRPTGRISGPQRFGWASGEMGLLRLQQARDWSRNPLSATTPVRWSRRCRGQELPA